MAATSITEAFAAGGVALVLALLAGPAMIRVANRFGLVDEPRGWKTHARATPYLGGGAVMLGFLPAAAVFGGSDGDVLALLAGTALLFAVGMLDDRYNLDFRLRILLVSAVGGLLGFVGAGWEVADAELVNVALSAAWCLVVVNAINLLDLLDGAAAGTAAACAAAVATYAALTEQHQVAVQACALTGACLGFLRFNLKTPSAIFLGNGGSMGIALVLAGTTMQLSAASEEGGLAIGLGAALIGIPLFDLIFRIYSRLRRGVSLLTPGPDSVANWLSLRLGSARATAAALALGQLTVGGLAIAGAEAGRSYLLVAVAAIAALGLVTVALLHASGFPDGAERARPAPSAGR